MSRIERDIIFSSPAGTLIVTIGVDSRGKFTDSLALRALDRFGEPLSTRGSDIELLAASIGSEVLRIFYDSKEVGDVVAQLVKAQVIHIHALQRITPYHAKNRTNVDLNLFKRSIQRGHNDTLKLLTQKIYCGESASKDDKIITTTLILAMCRHETV